MINRVHFESFKSLKDVTLELGRLTVLVGPNGCGKSSVLQGIEILAQAGVPREGEEGYRHRRFHMLFQGRLSPGRIASRGKRTTTKFVGLCGSDELTLEFRAPVATAERPKTEVSEYRITLHGPDGHTSIATSEGPKQKELDTLLQSARVQRFASAVYLHLDANRMATTSVSSKERPTMGADGSQLASALAWMKGAAEDELAQVTRGLQRVVPGVKRIRTLREQIARQTMDKIEVDGQPVWRPVQETLVGDRFELEFDDGHSIPADLLSEGTVLALGLLTKLYEPGRPRLVLLDDIDRGLHIGAQAQLVEVLRELLELEPELQIVCSTHSPYLLDRFEPAEVRLLGLDAERHTRALALRDHPEYANWKFGTQTGELWAALGDAWATEPQEPKA